MGRPSSSVWVAAGTGRRRVGLCIWSIFLAGLCLSIGVAQVDNAWAANEGITLLEPIDGASVTTHTEESGVFTAVPASMKFACPASIHDGYNNSHLFYDTFVADSVEGLNDASPRFVTRHSGGICEVQQFLIPGTYYWRVETESPFTNGLISSEIQSFEIVRPSGIKPVNIFPEDGAVIRSSRDWLGGQSANVQFRFTCPRYTLSFGSQVGASNYYVKVATSDQPGPSGFPAEIYRVIGGWETKPSNAAETECRAAVEYRGTPIIGLQPGRYYWQVYASDPDIAEGKNRSQIWSFTVQAGPGDRPDPRPSPDQPKAAPNQTKMTARQASRYSRITIRHRFRRKASRIQCVRLSARSFRCSARYRKNARKQFRVRIVLWHVANADHPARWKSRVLKRMRA